MNKPLFLFVGKSSSGKTTVANNLEERYGCKQVFSYTTRAPRHDGEIGHVFITDDEFDNLGELAAYTFYNGHRYGTTFHQLDECNIYVVDVHGVQTLLEKCKNYNRTICIVYFDATVYNRIHRMLDRGDSDMQIIARLLQDEKDDWYHQLDALAWHYANNEHMPIELYKVNANSTLQEVTAQILCYMRNHNNMEG